MSLHLEGIEAEKKARLFLKKFGVNNIQQLDWLVKLNDKYFIVEVKERELYSPPPFYGTGLDIRQLNLRLQVYNDLGIDTILIVFEKNTNNVYVQKISILEQGEHHDTKNKIRIYKIDNFNKYNYDVGDNDG
jgi:hypothetical protein